MGRLDMTTAMVVEGACMDCGQKVTPGEHSGHTGHFTGAWYCHDCGPYCDKNETIGEDVAYAMYDEMLDDAYQTITIGSGVYYPSQVLKKIDPIAYQVGFNEYVDSLSEDDILVEGYTA
jgi:hypothetical protein